MSCKKNKAAYSPLGALVSKIEGGGTPSKEVPGFWDGDIPLLTIKDLPNARLGVTVDRITAKGLESSSSKIVPAGIPVIATRMDVGRVVRCPVPVAINQDLRAIYPDPDKVDVDYIVQVLPTLEREFRRYSCGSTVMGIGIDDLKSIKIYLPPLAEQRKIAEILRTWDEAIETSEAELKAKQGRKRWMMDQLMRLGPTGVARSSRSGWSAEKLGDILEIHHGKNQREVETPEGIYPILGTGGVIGRTNAYLYDKPSVMIGRKGTIDRPQYMDTPFWTIDTLFYTSISERAFPRFIFYVFCTINWQQYNAATGVPSLAAATIESIKIQLPPLAEQRKIAEILQAVDADTEVINCRVKTLRAQKRGLMQKLLTGEVRVAA